MIQLRSTEFGLWAKIFGMDGLGGKLSWLRERKDDETLTIKELKTRYFNPPDEYMAQTLASPNVDAFIRVTKKKVPLYMITGMKAAIGASMSKSKEKTTTASGDGSLTELHSMTQVGGKASYMSEDKAAASFEGSTDFVLGYRLRKIFWRDGVMQISDKVAGSTLEDDGAGVSKADVLAGIEIIDDFKIESDSAKMFEDEQGLAGIEPSIWILP